MAAKKVTLKHQTADGKVHTRTTARTYSHVIVKLTGEGYIQGRKVPAGLNVVGWVGRPDLVAAQLRLHGPTSTAEEINGGTRDDGTGRGDVEGAYVATASGEGPAA